MRLSSVCVVFALALLLAPARSSAQRMCQNCVLLSGAMAHVATFATNTEGPLIDNQGVAHSLLQKLQATLEASTSGRTNASLNMVSAFQHEVNAQTGKHINMAAAGILNQDATAIIGAAQSSD